MLSACRGSQTAHGSSAFADRGAGMAFLLISHQARGVLNVSLFNLNTNFISCYAPVADLASPLPSTLGVADLPPPPLHSILGEKRTND